MAPPPSPTGLEPSLDSISDLNFSNIARRSASMSSCCLKSILRLAIKGLARWLKRGFVARLAAKRGDRRQREAMSSMGGGGGGGGEDDEGGREEMIELTETREGGGDTAWSGLGEGDEWMELVSVDVLRGDGDLELGGLIAKGSCKNGEGEEEVGIGGVGLV